MNEFFFIHNITPYSPILCLSTLTYCLDTTSFSPFVNNTSNLPDNDGLMASILSELITKDLEALKKVVSLVAVSNS